MPAALERIFLNGYQRGAGPLFRVRESSSSRSLLANVNEKKLGVGKAKKPLDRITYPAKIQSNSPASY